MIEANAIKGKNLLLRADLDVPLEAGEVANAYRLECLLPTLKLCLLHGRSTLIIGHNGRPIGEDPHFSLKPVKDWLEKSLNQAIYFISSGYSPGEWNRVESPLAMMENLRFSPSEEKISLDFATQIAAGSDIYVYDAFANFHPSTSLHKTPEVLPTLTGLQFDLEVDSLSRVIGEAQKPSLLLISGAKDDKRDYARRLTSRFDQVILGGKLAKVEDFTSTGLDLNSAAVTRIQSAIASSRTIVMNGPLGKFEIPEGATATRSILQTLKDSSAYILLGGGDTLAAIKALGFDYSDFSFVSTGGGAMLEFLSTLTHPLLEVVKEKSVN